MAIAAPGRQPLTVGSWSGRLPVSVGDMARDEFEAGDHAPAAGLYLQLNVLGTLTGETVEMQQGEMLPALPRGFSWKPLSAHTTVGLFQLAVHHRNTAKTASARQTRDHHLRLSQVFEGLAERLARQ